MGVYDIIVTLWHFKNNFFKFITTFFKAGCSLILLGITVTTWPSVI